MADIATRISEMSDDEILKLHASMMIVREEEIVSKLKLLPIEDRKAAFHALDLKKATRDRIRVRWEDVWARPSQLPPEGNWRTWLALAGRGFGKTEAGAQWIRQRVRDGARKIAIIAETQKDLEEVMIARLISISPPNEAPNVRYKPVRVIWPNGAMAFGYNGTEPDQLRGPEFDTAWVDELAKYAYARETWDMLQFTMRSGDDPRVFVTTTPRPIPIIREIIANRSTAVTSGSTMENAANLAPKFLEEVIKKYEGTRLGRQELHAEILDDVPGALWTRQMIDESRVDEAPEMARIVVAVDPSGTHGEADEEANEVGIVVVGLGVDGRGYVIADLTCNLSPDGWGRRAVGAYHDFQADRIIAETNYGGAMVAKVIRSVDPNVPFSEVKASRGTGGKGKRAEPIAAFYEQGRVSHVGVLTKLEDQMMLLTSAGFTGEGSPDRVDAVVWGLTDIMINSTQVFPTAIPEFRVAPFAPPATWPRGFAMKIESEATFVLWACFDRLSDTLYITTEHVRHRADPAVNAAAILARGKWIPGIVESEETNLLARRELATIYAAQGLNVRIDDRAVGAGIAEANARISTARLKVFATCQGFFSAYRSFRRDEGGEIIGGGLMDCLRSLCRPAVIQMMKPKPDFDAWGREKVPGMRQEGHFGDRKMGY